MDHRIVEKEIERRNAEFNYLQKKKAEELKEKRKSRHDWHLAFSMYLVVQSPVESSH